MNKIKNRHPSKEQFPKPFQNYYYNTPLSLPKFPNNISETCIVVPEAIIDADKGTFCDPKSKKADQIHHCGGIGLIENKTGNYSSAYITEKFSEHKSYLEKKYQDFPVCKVTYYVLKAERMSEKLKKELRCNKQKELYFHQHPNKKRFTIKQCPVYFVERK